MKNTVSGDDQQLIDANFQYWEKYAGRIVSEMLGDKQYINGSEFTGLDVILGYNMRGKFTLRWRGVVIIEQSMKKGAGMCQSSTTFVCGGTG